jgi:hypothetical protein
MHPSASAAFTAALGKHKVALPPTGYTIYNTYLSDLPAASTTPSAAPSARKLSTTP